MVEYYFAVDVLVECKIAVDTTIKYKYKFKYKNYIPNIIMDC